ncbi:hypothetical protein NG788_08335 [Aliarcobacter cryaerophilus]|uniref:hypothetical protein n=1 Tax=Aliarcobacter cryaerophilus TaxID=28198 RepID=UPI003DA6C611
MNNYYEELISYKKDEIKDFFKNTKLFDSQFKYDSFNETCNKKMFGMTPKI